MNKILLFTLIMLLSISIVSATQSELISPTDGKYLIKGGSVENNITFNINATPTSLSTGAIKNVTLWTNISGTWKANYTNTSVGTVNTKINRIFKTTDTKIYSGNLADGKVFIWNVRVCDNVSRFINEAVTLNNGEGQLAHYPLSSVLAYMNSTGNILGGFCNVTTSTGVIKCNDTSEGIWNGSAYINISNTNPILVNYTLGSLTCAFAPNNRTVYVEDAPTVYLTYPTDGMYTQTQSNDLIFNVTGDSASYGCELYANDTVVWHSKGDYTATNHSSKTGSVVFDVGRTIWNIKCWESANSNIYGWYVSNYTVYVVSSNPSITINEPSDNKYVNNIISSVHYSALINITTTSSNPEYCTLKLNGADNLTLAYTSGTALLMRFNASDAEYEWNVICNDSSHRTTETSNRTITIDTIYPHLLRHRNYSNSYVCKGFTVEFNFSEDVNATFKYGLTSYSQTYAVRESDFNENQTVILTFNNSYETLFYSNITVCDLAGNCNNSITQKTIKSPISLCTGWSIYSIYDSAINLSTLSINSGADYVYVWNNTGQSWNYYSSLGTTGVYDLGIGSVVHLYESGNTTYFRNTTGTASYLVNVTAGHMYFPLYHDFEFGNISYVVFKNATGGNATSQGKQFKIEYLASYNNSAQSYVSSIYTWSFNNNTMIGKNSKNGLDTLWAYVPQNLTINFTARGKITGNWT